jgi:very-short-patch-repair endonuclease
MNQVIHNTLRLKNIRRHLRRHMPKSEVVLWSYLKNKQLGVKFRRQHSIGPYIVDFYCPTKRLVVEVDGETHFSTEQRIVDHQRDAYFKQYRIVVLRFLNTDVKENVRGVIDEVIRVLAELPPLTPPHLRRG